MVNVAQIGLHDVEENLHKVHVAFQLVILLKQIDEPGHLVLLGLLELSAKDHGLGLVDILGARQTVEGLFLEGLPEAADAAPACFEQLLVGQREVRYTPDIYAHVCFPKFGEVSSHRTQLQHWVLIELLADHIQRLLEAL